MCGMTSNKCINIHPYIFVFTDLEYNKTPTNDVVPCKDFILCRNDLYSCIIVMFR